MHHLRRPSTVIALVALFLSLGGSAIAAKHYLITSTSQIKPSVLRQLRGTGGPQGATGPSGPQGAAGPQGTTGAQGGPGSQGPAGPTNLSALTTILGPSVSVPTGKVGSSVATCPTGSHAVSGGGFGSVSGIDVTEMSSDHQSWIVEIANTTGITETVEAEAYCATAGEAVAARTNASARARAVREAQRLAQKLEAVKG